MSSTPFTRRSRRSWPRSSRRVNRWEPQSAGTRYATSKLVEIMYGHETAHRFERAGSAKTAVAFDPGSNPSTGFLRDMPAFVRWASNTAFTTWVFRRLGFATSTPAFSGAALADLALDRYGANGLYYEAREGTVDTTRSSKTSYDTGRALKLWDDSERLARLSAEERPSVLA